MPYCLGCAYVLDGLKINRCPECGRVFDPDDASSYSVRARAKMRVGPLTTSFLLGWLFGAAAILSSMMLSQFDGVATGPIRVFGGWITLIRPFTDDPMAMIAAGALPMGVMTAIPFTRASRKSKRNAILIMAAVQIVLGATDWY
jgi:hypothetical protein